MTQKLVLLGFLEQFLSIMSKVLNNTRMGNTKGCMVWQHSTEDLYKILVA